jgi:hypothetical protein
MNGVLVHQALYDKDDGLTHKHTSPRACDMLPAEPMAMAYS